MKTSNHLTWGKWKLTLSTCELKYVVGPGQSLYNIDLETITSSSQMLDWIFQLRGKTYITSQDLADLLHAFKDLFDPQHYLCSSGMDKRISNIPKHIHRERRRQRELEKWSSKCLTREDYSKLVINRDISLII